MVSELDRLINKQKQRTFSTVELSIIRNVLKLYGNENYQNMSELESGAIKMVWEKVKKLHIQQKNEDKYIENLW